MSCNRCLHMHATQCYWHLHDDRMFLLFQSLLFTFLLSLLTLMSSSFILQAYLLLIRSFGFIGNYVRHWSFIRMVSTWTWQRNLSLWSSLPTSCSNQYSPFTHVNHQIELVSAMGPAGFILTHIPHKCHDAKKIQKSINLELVWTPIVRVCLART
jgi:hypothetical protein